MNIESAQPAQGRNAMSSRTEMLISGMTCGNCARHVTEALQGVPGVHSAQVSLDAHQASVRWTADSVPDVAALVRSVEKEGYGATVVDASTVRKPGARESSGWDFTLWIGLIGTAALMIGEWVLGPWFRWAAFGVATAVQAIAGAPFYRGAWNQLRTGGSNMDTLVALGSSAAYGYSAWALLSGYGGHLYFMEAAAIITLISVGHWIEARVSAKASDALRQLLNLAPQTARRIGKGSDEIEEVPVAQLQVGDRVLLRPGDRVATDGEIVEGESAVDEAMLTGESIPVDKRPGSQVYTGTVNVNGRLVVRVLATGEDTALAHVIATVQRAQTSRASIQRLGDRVSSVFVPIVVLIAVLAGLWWGLAPDHAARVNAWFGQFLWPAHVPVGTMAASFVIVSAVLIIACPCAMGLATPAAIMAGSNAAAKRGILIRDGVALEKAGTVTAVVFDKTGTLTEGKPAVAATWTSGNSLKQTQSHGLVLAAALAKHSSHPISKAIAQVAPTDLPLIEWQEIPGAGVEARMTMTGKENRRVRLGSLQWLRETGLALEPGERFIAEWSAQGTTLVGVASGTELVALIAVKDVIKPAAGGVVGRLKSNGHKVYLLTGDNQLTAMSVAERTGIARENVFAEVRPEQKAGFVKKLQDEGLRVAFVGDGINDAPALEQADLGIAVSRASDIAREAADIILIRSEIEAVPEALGLANATLRTIRQNLFWAFFYNAVGVPLAALGFMSPILCAAAMGFSDLIVIGNALRLRRWRLDK